MHTIFSPPLKKQREITLLEEINIKYEKLYLSGELDPSPSTLNTSLINDCLNTLRLIECYQAGQSTQSESITEMKVYLYSLKGEARKYIGDPDYIDDFHAVLRNEPHNQKALKEISQFGPAGESTAMSSICIIS